MDAILHVLIRFGALTGRWQPRLRLLGDNVPSVDVIVTVCNEKIDIVKDTVRAALSVEYPVTRFRVIVADDGKSKVLEDWVHQFSVDHANLYYTARSTLGGWKAGNLNEAIKFAGFLPGGAAELVAGLDADMIPEPRWLRCVTAHIMRDRKTGVVCPAQVSSLPLAWWEYRPTETLFFSTFTMFRAMILFSRATSSVGTVETSSAAWLVLHLTSAPAGL